MPPPNRPSSRLSQPRDPLVADPQGSTFASQPEHFERGTVLEVDARRHAYRVVVGSGRAVSMGRLLTNPGDTSLLQTGDVVLVFYGLGVPYILGVLPPGSEHADSPESLSGVEGMGSADPALDRGLPVSARSPRAPADLLPGDAALLGPDGASLAALRGRVAQLSGGPFAQVQAFGDTDKVRILAGEIIQETWMGRSETVNEGGKTSFRWRGGSDQLTQTGADEGRYTIALDVGHSGNVLNLEITNREGQALFRLHVDPQGHAELFAAGGFSQTHGNEPGATQESAHHGNAVHTVTGRRQHEIGQDEKIEVGRHWSLKAGGLVEVVSGSRVSLIGSEGAALQGGGEVQVRGGDKVTVQGAGIELDPLLDKLNVKTALPDAILLGSNPSNHVTLYEPLLSAVQTLTADFNALRAAFAMHTHPVISIPGGSAAGPNPLLSSYATPRTYPWARCASVVVKAK